MARGLLHGLVQILRAQEQPTRAMEREAARQLREAERQQKALERQSAAHEKEQRRLYTASRVKKVEAMNRRLEERVAELKGLLAHALDMDDYLNLDAIKRKPEIPRFEPGGLSTAVQGPRECDYLPAAPSFFKKLVPGAKKRYERALEEGRQRYFKAQLAAGKAEAIVDYFALILERSRYPDSFPQHARMAYVPESKQLVVEYDLPSFDVVPEVRAYKYNKSRDLISEVSRPTSERKSIYSSVVAQVTLRTLHEVFGADRLRNVETLVFNGHVKSVDAATGKNVRPCLVSVRTTRAIFDDLELGRVDPVACLKALNASVSKKPDELVPVRPVLEFNMVDPRFIEEANVLSELDKRPNLMELTPSEFESLITNLFERMGLETRQTQPSRDGGVDCVAYDPRPIFGGKVVIQAKRYKNTVGVSAVRDLFGTLQNEGASKGILVTTSGYGKAAFEFAEGKPIELLSGSNLLYLLAEHAGIEAKIVPPDDWKDPPPDTGGGPGA